MGIMAESMITYVQPLLDETDGSQEQMQNALSIAQMCWNLALLPEKEQRDSLAKMQAVLKMDADEFADFCESIIMPMIRRHREMFPNMSRTASETTLSSTLKDKYPGTGRNELCPCKSGKKYKRCCGR
jgi:uncharacterized protein YecA (UPF0149 family)